MHATEPIAGLAPPPFKIEGALVVGTVADWHRRLAERMSTTPRLALDLGEVTTVDVFGLQLLLSARLTATRHGGTFTTVAVPPVFADACAAAGIPSSLFPVA